MTLERLEPIFPVRDLTGAIAHWWALGFEVEAYEGPIRHGSLLEKAMP